MPIISGGGGVFSTAGVTLTDAQIKALPTTPVVIVAAPGAGKLLVPVTWVIQKSFVASAYTNVDAAAALKCNYNASIPGSNNGVAVLESGFSVFGAASLEQFPIPTGTYDDGNGGSFPPGGSDLRNLNLTVNALNGGLGNFTGGDAANTLTVVVFYTVVSL